MHVKLLEFLIDANQRIHQGLSLRYINTYDLKIVYNFDWSVFLLSPEEQAQSNGFSFLQQLRQQSGPQPPQLQQRQDNTTEASSVSRLAKFRQSSGLLVGSEDAGDSDIAERIDGRDAMINQLLSTGAILMRQGVFALPKLAWTQEEHPDEARVLEMTGFLLDAYHKDAWWWEVFEMWRKLMLAGAILLIPAENGRQIAFALFITMIALFVSLRTSPYIHENLLKLHLMSLSVQCITLFYALLLEVEDLSSVAQVCVDGTEGTCSQQDVYDVIMETVLSLLQAAVFVLPCWLALRDNGVFDALRKTAQQRFKTLHKWARVLIPCMKFTAQQTHKERWPLGFALETRKTGLRTPTPKQGYGTRKRSPEVPCKDLKSVESRQTGSVLAPRTQTRADRSLREAGSGVGAAASSHSVDEIVVQVEEMQDTRPAETVTISMHGSRARPRNLAQPTASTRISQDMGSQTSGEDVEGVEKARLAAMLKEFGLHRDADKIASVGLEQPSDLAYFTEERIKDLPGLTRLCKGKLVALAEYFAAGESTDDSGGEKERVEGHSSRIPFSRRNRPGERRGGCASLEQTLGTHKIDDKMHASQDRDESVCCHATPILSHTIPAVMDMAGVADHSTMEGSQASNQNARTRAETGAFSPAQAHPRSVLGAMPANATTSPFLHFDEDGTSFSGIAPAGLSSVLRTHRPFAMHTD